MIDAVRGDYPLEVEEVDIFDHPEIALAHRVLTTPALLIDGQLAFTGRVTEAALRQRLGRQS